MPSLQFFITQPYPAPVERAIRHISLVLQPALKYLQALDKTLSNYFRENRQIGSSERYWIAEAVYEVVRRRAYFDFQIEKIRSQTRISHYRAYAVMGLSVLAAEEHQAAIKHIGAQVQDALTDVRNQLRRDKTPLPPHIRYSLPEWLWHLLVEEWGEETVLPALAALHHSAPLDLRVNRQRAKRDEVLSNLLAKGLPVSATPYAELGLRLQHKINLADLPEFANGMFEVQDEGSQLIAQMLAPKRGEVVVDFCAGAGGKTLAMGDLMANKGVIYACDVAAVRLSKLKPRLVRSGLSNIQPMLLEDEHDSKLRRLKGRCDAVLVDAPCSGLGTLRRNPDLKWRHSPSSLASLQQQQLSILRAASQLLKPGGRLVYATCSLIKAENEAVVDHFLEAEKDFVRQDCADFYSRHHIPLPANDPAASAYLHLTPWQHHTDGFFAALLIRQPSKPAEAASTEAAPESAAPEVALEGAL